LAIFSLFIYSFFIFGPLADFGNVAAQYQEAKAANEQLNQILDIKPEEKPKDPIQVGRLKKIEFKDVSFQYSANSSDSLKSINIDVKSGMTVAFAGHQEAEDYDDEAYCRSVQACKRKILLNGVDASTVDYDDVRKRLGLVSQETQLFAGTIRENLLFVNPKLQTRKSRSH